jgi:hypothetical protein
MRASLAFLVVFLFLFTIGATEAAAPVRLAPGKPATVRKAQTKPLPGIALVGAAGLVIAGILILAPSDAQPAATATGTNP